MNAWRFFCLAGIVWSFLGAAPVSGAESHNGPAVISIRHSGENRNPPNDAEDGNRELIIVREEGLEVSAGQLRQLYPGAKRSVKGALGWNLGRPPRVVLTADHERFEKVTGSPLVSAAALPGQHTIVMLVSPAAGDSYVLYETLQHELCHLVLHAHISQGLLPKWLDEGICQWVSGSLGEILAGQGLVSSGRNLARHPIPLPELAESFPGDRPSLLQAYEESRRFVDFLVARHGKEGLLGLLERLKAGRTIHEAAVEAFSTPLSSLEAEWRQELRSSSLWLLWLSRYLYEILFVLGALLTVLGFVRLLIRKRTYDLEEDDEE